MKLNIETSDPLKILSSTRFVVENSVDVEINPVKIKEVIHPVKDLINQGLEDPSTGLGASGNFPEDMQTIFIEDVVNFCFWAEKGKEKWTVEYPKGNIVKGGWYGLVACFKRAKEENVPILDARYLADITQKEINEFFRSSNGISIPLLNKRKENLIEAGKVLSEKYDGKFINLFEEANSDAVEVIKRVVENFPSFRDEAFYKNKKIYIYKRAQIVASDIGYLSKYDKRGKLNNLNELTAFADYKLPQILRDFGIIVYSKDLADKVDNYELIKSGSSEEIEIRAATIWTVELIRQQMQKYLSFQIDNALWLLSQEQNKIGKPYHRTYTIYY